MPILLDKFEVEKKNYYEKKSEELLLGSSISSYEIEVIKYNHHDSFNRNYWNEKCYTLFLYLVENYEKKGKVKYINIWYFLKRHADKKLYTFNFTQKEYIKFIAKKYNEEIKKFEKAEHDFETQKSLLNSFELDFRDLKIN